MSSPRVVQINYGYHGASEHFCRGKTLIGKVIAVIILLAVCYPLQKYFQEDCVFRIQKIIRDYGRYSKFGDIYCDIDEH